MPSQYRRDLAGLKAAILGRVLAGESLRAIGRDPAMPCGQTVRSWAAGDVAFGAGLAEARGGSGWLRGFALRVAVAARAAGVRRGAADGLRGVPDAEEFGVSGGRGFERGDLRGDRGGRQLREPEPRGRRAVARDAAPLVSGRPGVRRAGGLGLRG